MGGVFLDWECHNDEHAYTAVGLLRTIIGLYLKTIGTQLITSTIDHKSTVALSFPIVGMRTIKMPAATTVAPAILNARKN